MLIFDYPTGTFYTLSVSKIDLYTKNSNEIKIYRNEDQEN